MSHSSRTVLVSFYNNYERLRNVVLENGVSTPETNPFYVPSLLFGSFKEVDTNTGFIEVLHRIDVRL